VQERDLADEALPRQVERHFYVFHDLDHHHDLFPYLPDSFMHYFAKFKIDRISFLLEIDRNAFRKFVQARGCTKKKEQFLLGVGVNANKFK
jgi:hypothetical protein